jgi:hypothetical protein
MDTEFVLVGMLSALFALAARGSMTRDTLDWWRAGAVSAGLSSSLGPWLDLVDALFVSHTLNAESAMRDTSLPWPFQAAASIRYAIDEQASPAGLLTTHDYWANAIPKSDSQTFALPDVELIVARAWLSMADRPFLLRAPASTVPALRRACSGSSTGWRKIGEILMAASDAVPSRVPPDMRERFQKLTRDF